MLIPLSQSTHKAWLRAVQLNQKAILDYHGASNGPCSLTNWTLRNLEPDRNDKPSVQRFMVLIANKQDNPDLDNPIYFDWSAWCLDLESMPDELQIHYPPSNKSIFKYGVRYMSGGLVNDNGKWSSHT